MGGTAPQDQVDISPRCRSQLAGVVSVLRPLICCFPYFQGPRIPSGHASAAHPRAGEDEVPAQALLVLTGTHQPHLALHTLVLDQLQD